MFNFTIFPALLLLITAAVQGQLGEECEGFVTTIAKTKNVNFPVCTDVFTEVMKKADSSGQKVNPESVRQTLLDYCKNIVGKDDKKEKLVNLSQ